ncbi:MAG: hypothetical protein SCJ94_06785 [Bacillota bacterium]|nr:hypothetical protein [Bacillota bacterium]
MDLLAVEMIPARLLAPAAGAILALVIYGLEKLLKRGGGINGT